MATCGEITPLSTLDYLIGSFDSDIITMDYRVRGFTGTWGQEAVLDHDVVSIQHYIDPPPPCGSTTRWDINVYEANLFHTKMMVKDIDLQNYLFNTDVYELHPRVRWRSCRTCAGDDRDLQRAEHLLTHRGKEDAMLSQARAPIYEALQEFEKRRVVPFDVPGHKRGRGNPN